MIKEKLQADQIAAMKSGEKDRLDTLRYILAQIKNKEIDKQVELTDDDVIAVLKKQSKELQESIEAFEKGNRTDLAGQYKTQKAVVDSYLPAEISDEELEKAVKDLITAHQDAYKANPKSIIGICMKELRSKADPARIMKVLQSITS